MGLATVQRHLAALLLEAPERDAFAADAPALLRSRGVHGRDAALLASLDPDDLAYFASRRAIDRMVALRAELPRSARLLDAKGRLLWYLRAHPYAEPSSVREARRFARWARRAAKAGQVPALLPDLAAYEAEVLRVGLAPPREPRPSAHPRRAPGTAVLRLGHAVHLSRGQKVPTAPAQETFLGLVRTAADVQWYRFEAVDHELLRTAHGRTPEAAWLAAAAKRAGVRVAAARESARQLRSVGLLCPHLA